MGTFNLDEAFPNMVGPTSRFLKVKDQSSEPVELFSRVALKDSFAFVHAGKPPLPLEGGPV